MKHYVLTRSAYGSGWSLSANRRRLDVTRAVTARLMAAQTTRDWAWVVLLDPFDPLLEERKAVFAAAAPTFLALPWIAPPEPKAAEWDRHAATTNHVQRVAAAAYRAPWAAVLGDRGVKILQTRLDDDDGLSPDALVRYQAAAHRVSDRTILMLPRGVRVWRGMYADVTHQRNAMHTLVTPAGDDLSVYAYPHASCDRDRRTGGAKVVTVDHGWGWIWVRHRDTISGYKRADRVITRRVTAAFPLDWEALRRTWT